MAVHPELVDKLVSFQNSILGTGDSCMDELSKEKPNIAVEFKADDSHESVEVNVTNIPLVSYVPKASKSSASNSSSLSGIKIICILLCHV